MKSNQGGLLLLLTIFLTIGLIPPKCQGVRILSFSFFTSRSHKILYEDLLVQLARRGHEVTIVNPYTSKFDNDTNIRQIQVLSPDLLEEEGTMPNMFDMKGSPFFEIVGLVMDPFITFAGIMEEICRRSYQLPQIQSLMKEKFDLIIFDHLFNDCLYGLGAHFKTPLILISSVTVMPWISTGLGNPINPSFVPFSFYKFTDQMNFGERLLNFALLSYNNLIRTWYFNPKMEKIYRDLVDPNLPSIKEIESNVSLVLCNSHTSFTRPKPLMPDIIDVGGMHLKPAKPLPKKFQDFIDGAGEDGFILFSFGSALKGILLPETKRKMFLNTFAKLKQRVIWKWETEDMEDLPKNVMLSKWVPQQDVLAHTNIKMFITHGGHGSTQESIYHGVPLVGIPMFGDQPYNMHLASKHGFAINLEFTELTEQVLGNAINEILSDAKYGQTAKKLSTLFHDQIDKPLDRALYWTEYIIRHGGAPHLKSAGRELNFFQYFSLDVIATLVTILGVIGYIDFLIVRAIYRKCCGQKGGPTSSIKKRQ